MKGRGYPPANRGIETTGDPVIRKPRVPYFLRRLISRLCFFPDWQNFQRRLLARRIAGLAEHSCRRHDHVMSGSDIDLSEMKQSCRLAALVAQFFVGDESGLELSPCCVQVVDFEIKLGHAGARCSGKSNVLGFMRQRERTGVEIKCATAISSRRVNCSEAVHDQRLALLI